MTAKSASLFEETVQLTHLWLKQLMEELGWTDRHRAYLALRLTLHAVRDHLTVDQAAKLGAQLPMLVRGFYYEGWHPAHKPLKDRSVEGFMTHLDAGFRRSPLDEPIDPVAVTQAVFTLLGRHLSEGEADHLMQALPKGLRKLWPAGYQVSPEIVPL